MERSINTVSLSTLLALIVSVTNLQGQDSGIPELESFIADESASALLNTVMPTEREISGLFSDAKSILEIQNKG